MMTHDQNAIIGRILEKLDCPALLNKFDNLSPSEASSLFMALYNRLNGCLKPSDILKNYAHKRYAAPSDRENFRARYMAKKIHRKKEPERFFAIGFGECA